jgi:serine phosphatase RsbU (regulator of sigma subunit)
MNEKYKIVIIGDESLMPLDFKLMLTRANYDIVGVYSSGEETIEKIGEVNPDILLVDIMLAGKLTGIETVSKLKEKSDICVIYITSNAYESVREEVKETHPMAFLNKSIGQQQLLDTIELAINKFSKNKKEKEKIEKKYKRSKMQIEELSETNNHLATATLRERDLKKELQKTLNELEESKKIIEKQNKSILDSINYAKRIQKAIIPKLEDIRKDLPITDWMYKSKDVVSGDFPYYYKKGSLIYYAAVDCTGHGVPGAMMSLIGHLLLNDILNDKEVLSPAEVLKKLHNGVVRTLKQDKPENKAADGMDVGICCYNIETKKLEYSGAHRPLYVVRSGQEIIQYKGGKYPVGGNQYNGKNEYPNYEIDLLPEDTVYFFSDGYPDQFGGKEDLKFGPKKMRKLLEEHSEKTITENIEILSNSFEGWMGNKKQIDDVLLIGVKFL